MNNVVIILMITFFLLSVLHVFTVTRTKVRSTIATCGIINGVTIVLCELALAGLYLRVDYFINAGFETAFALWIAWLTKRYFGDDDWFVKKFKKLKKSLRNLGKRLSNVRLPSLMPAPNPA